MGFGAFKQLASQFSKSGRNVKKKQKSLQGRTRQAQIKGLEDQSRALQLIQPRERAGLKQGAFARGLGKSTIFQQNDDFMRERHEMQVSQNAREYDLALRGKTLEGAINKFNKNFKWADDLDAVVSFASSVWGATTGSGFWGTGATEPGVGAGASASQGVGGGVFG